jgi:hypothetical protein
MICRYFFIKFISHILEVVNLYLDATNKTLDGLETNENIRIIEDYIYIIIKRRE